MNCAIDFGNPPLVLGTEEQLVCGFLGIEVLSSLHGNFEGFDHPQDGTDEPRNPTDRIRQNDKQPPHRTSAVTANASEHGEYYHCANTRDCPWRS
jgi:hypothetical protein